VTSTSSTGGSFGSADDGAADAAPGSGRACAATGMVGSASDGSASAAAGGSVGVTPAAVAPESAPSPGRASGADVLVADALVADRLVAGAVRVNAASAWAIRRRAPNSRTAASTQTATHTQ
jgi:hypothetical protein